MSDNWWSAPNWDDASAQQKRYASTPIAAFVVGGLLIVGLLLSLLR